jgi:hypothetical protein
MLHCSKIGIWEKQDSGYIMVDRPGKRRLTMAVGFAKQYGVPK